MRIATTLTCLLASIALSACQSSTSGGAATTGLLDAGVTLRDAASPVAEPDGGPIVPLLFCTPACTGSRPCVNACGRPATQTCSFVTGCLSACPNPTEICNGIDDDCDGQVDEGGAALCNDGASCTTDACSTIPQPGFPPRPPIVTCTHTPVNTSCDDHASCTADSCSPTQAGADANGCVHTPNHAFCIAWDGCDCNGPEICAPGTSGADATTGCAQSPHCPSPPGTGSSTWPCEQGGDGRCCTYACCEPPGHTSCRMLRAQAIAANPGHTPAQIDVDVNNAISTCNAIPVGHTAVSSIDNATLHCPPEQPVCPASANPCESFPCNEAAGGTCGLHYNNGPQPMCGLDAAGNAVYENGGCAQRQCASGGCFLSRVYLAASNPALTCQGQADGCMQRVCNPAGTASDCITQPNQAFCDAANASLTGGCASTYCSATLHTCLMTYNSALCPDDTDPCIDPVCSPTPTGTPDPVSHCYHVPNSNPNCLH